MRSTAGAYVNSTAVQLQVEGSDPSCYPLSLWMSDVNQRTNCTAVGSVSFSKQQENLNDNNPAGHVLTTLTWSVPLGDGLKGICAVLRNPQGGGLGRSRVWGFNLILDQTKPTTPGDFRETACSITTNDRNVTVAWNTASDLYFSGYRIYRSIEDGPFTLLKTSAALSTTDTTVKTYSSVRYMVRAYDKAGNESLDSAIVSYARNEC
jgi:hypothetical protein